MDELIEIDGPWSIFTTMYDQQVSVDFPIDEDRIDEDAAFVLRRLRRAGHEAYLVGGSVRDLLLNRQPKDFDVATSAAPEQIKSLFKRCRLIGRRFRLAHIMGQKGRVIETATFRSKPQTNSRDDIIWDDNEFGTVESDAHRRDFTVNALFFCIESERILDFTDGLPDLNGRILRTIGDPMVRFREDPVRILRAIKFAARLDFAIETQSLAALRQETGLLARAAVPRLYEELIRMLRGGASRKSVQLMSEYGVFELLVPEVFALIPVDDTALKVGYLGPLLDALDRLIPDKRRVSNSVALAALFWPVAAILLENGQGYRGPQQFRVFAKTLLHGFARRLAVPRRTMESLIALMDSHFRVERISRRRSARSAFSRTPYYRDACQFAELRYRAGDMDEETFRKWQAMMTEFPGAPQVKKYQRNWRRR